MKTAIQVLNNGEYEFRERVSAYNTKDIVRRF